MLPLIRSLLFYAWYIPSGALVVLFTVLAGPFMPLRWRLTIMGKWQYSVLLWLRITCGVVFSITGKEKIPPPPYIVISNHQGQWEPYLFQSLFHPLIMVVKQELLRIPIWGWALALLKPVAINRQNARQSLRKILLQGQQRIDRGLSILLFPEGTRMPPGKLGQFKRSSLALAAETGVPIVPVVHNSGDCWPAHQLRKSPGKISVIIGDPVMLSDKSITVSRQMTEWMESTYRAIRHHS